MKGIPVKCTLIPVPGPFGNSCSGHIPALSAPGCSHSQYKVGVAGELPCPGVAMAEWHGDGTGMGKSWSLHWEGCSHLEAAAWSQFCRSFTGLGFEVTLRSIKLMKGDKP